MTSLESHGNGLEMLRQKQASGNFPAPSPLGLVAQQFRRDVLTQPPCVRESEAGAQSDESSPVPHNSSSCVSRVMASVDL